MSDITDHFPVFGFFNVPLKKRVFRPTYYRNFKSNRSSEFDNAFADILVLLHPDIANDFDPDEYLDVVIQSIEAAVDKVFPLRKWSNKQLKKYKNAWITQGILKSIKRCHYLHYLSITRKDELSTSEYKSYKLKLVRSIEKAKELEKQENFQRCSGDSTKTWKALNDYLKKKSKK